MKKLVVFDADGVLTNERSSWLYVHKGLGKDIVRKCEKLKKLYFNLPKWHMKLGLKKMLNYGAM
ncbi:MAG: hypothetical protein J7J15_01005 [Candidatus Aenigmarchaeota archaeon]|nr:hypothetical protein [Candidatus Aenigmarchaeota archaeon]